MKNISDEELMKRFVSTLREEPFDELVSRYMGKGIDCASAILNSQADAEDAVQETFLRIVRSRKTYDPEKPFAPWFFTILKHICWDMHAATAKESEKEKGKLIETHEDIPEASAEKDEILEVLSEPERRILAMRIVHGFSIDEIARLHNCSYEAAKKRCQRALAKLKEKIHASAERGVKRKGKK